MTYKIQVVQPETVVDHSAHRRVKKTGGYPKANASTELCGPTNFFAAPLKSYANHSSVVRSDETQIMETAKRPRKDSRKRTDER